MKLNWQQFKSVFGMDSADLGDEKMVNGRLFVVRAANAEGVELDPVDDTEIEEMAMED